MRAVLTLRGLLVCACLFAGCKTEVVRVADCTGVYVSNRGKAIDILSLMPEGKFAHYYVGPAGKHYRDTGSWRFDSDHGKDALVDVAPWFESFEGSDGNFGGGGRNMGVEKAGKVVRLMTQYDLDEYFEMKSRDWQVAEHVFDSVVDAAQELLPAN